MRKPSVRSHNLGKHYRINSAVAGRIDDFNLTPQCTACVKCLWLLQIGHGEDGWMSGDVVHDWLRDHYNEYGQTTQEPWRIFQFFRTALVESGALEVLDA